MWLWLPVAWGSTPIDRTIEASAEVVEVGVVCGEVRVLGSARKGVRISGTVDEAEGLEVESEGGRGPLSISTPEEARSCAHLTIEVPAGSALEVSTRDAPVIIEGATGSVEAESVSGDLTIRGSAASVEAQTVSGAIRITGGRRIEAATVSGNIELRDASGELTAATVSGNVSLAGSGLVAVEVESVSGTIELTGALVPEARVELGSHSGNVLARLPASTDARIELTSFSGRVRSAFGKGEEHTAGNGRGRIELASFSGDVILERTGDGAARAPDAPPAPPPGGPPVAPPLPPAPPAGSPPPASPPPPRVPAP